MPLLVFPGGYGGMVLADQGRLSLSCCIRRDTLAEIRAAYATASAAEAVHHHIIDRCRGLANAIGHASLDGPWLASGPIRPGIRSRYDRDIFRVGNIAGKSHPIIAEGISMAMQSGWLLADQLVRVDATRQAERALAAARYAAAWRRLFATRIHAASVFAQIAVQPASARIMTCGDQAAAGNADAWRGIERQDRACRGWRSKGRIGSRANDPFPAEPA